MKKLLAKVKNKKKGFTLVELIVVIGIIAILAAVLVPTLTSYLGNAKNSTAHTNAKIVYDAASTAATTVITNGHTLTTGDLGLAADLDSTGAGITTQSFLGNNHLTGTAVITVTSTGVTQVVYTDADGVTTATYQP